MNKIDRMKIQYCGECGFSAVVPTTPSLVLCDHPSPATLTEESRILPGEGNRWHGPRLSKPPEECPLRKAAMLLYVGGEQKETKVSPESSPSKLRLCFEIEGDDSFVDVEYVDRDFFPFSKIPEVGDIIQYPKGGDYPISRREFYLEDNCIDLVIVVDPDE